MSDTSIYKKMFTPTSEIKNYKNNIRNDTFTGVIHVIYNIKKNKYNSTSRTTSTYFGIVLSNMAGGSVKVQFFDKLAWWCLKNLKINMVIEVEGGRIMTSNNKNDSPEIICDKHTTVKIHCPDYITNDETDDDDNSEILIENVAEIDKIKSVIVLHCTITKITNSGAVLVMDNYSNKIWINVENNTNKSYTLKVNDKIIVKGRYCTKEQELIATYIKLVIPENPINSVAEEVKKSQ